MKSVLFSFAATAVVVGSLSISSNAAAQTRRAHGVRTPAAAAPNAAAADLPQSPAANPSTNLTESSTHHSLNWDAYADVAAVLPNKESYLISPAGSPVTKGFGVNDGALYLSKDFSRATAVVDLPFFSSSTDNSFGFASQKAQAYVNVNFGAVGVKLGQYDTFFGIEANDSIARFFASSGLMKTLVLPTTHTGVQATYAFGNQFTVRGQIANPNSFGLLKTGTDPEVGGQFRWDHNGIFAALGAEYGTARVDTNKTNLLVQGMGGATLGKLSFGGELNSKKSAGSDRNGLGIGLLAAYQLNDLLSLGGRLDFMQDIVYNRFDATASLNPSYYEKGTLVSGGASYKLDTDLTVRGDLSYLSSKRSDQSTNDIFGLTLSVVARL